MDLAVVILAAGQGKRMHSSKPKVLHPIGGLPLLAHVLKTAATLDPAELVVVVRHQAESVIQAFSQVAAQWIHQSSQAGTGHAVLEALGAVTAPRVLVLYGDVPLITTESLNRLLAATAQNEMGILTATLVDPSGFGRLVRDENGNIQQIIEDKDATLAQKALKEINTGILLASRDCLARWLPKLTPHNQQLEYYLTDIVEMAVAEGVKVCSAHPVSPEEILGVNDCEQLAHLERIYQQRKVVAFMRQGVTFLDPARFDLRGTLSVGSDVVFDINVILEGDNTMGNECMIGPHVWLKNVKLGSQVQILANTLIEGAVIGDNSIVGPFARIRPETELAHDVHVGNFVEVKKSTLGAFTKANHLSYLGDARVGTFVNMGAGVITCNYDGAHKHPTVIGDHAFIGSDTQLVAPVVVGEYATIGAGSTLTENAPPNELTLSRAKQQTVKHWKRPTKKEP